MMAGAAVDINYIQQLFQTLFKEGCLDDESTVSRSDSKVDKGQLDVGWAEGIARGPLPYGETRADHTIQSIDPNRTGEDDDKCPDPVDSSDDEDPLYNAIPQMPRATAARKKQKHRRKAYTDNNSNMLPRHLLYNACVARPV